MNKPRFKIKVIVMEIDLEQTTILDDCKNVAEEVSDKNCADTVFTFKDNVYRYLWASKRWIDLSFFQIELRKG